MKAFSFFIIIIEIGKRGQKNLKKWFGIGEMKYKKKHVGLSH